MRSAVSAGRSPVVVGLTRWWCRSTPHSTLHAATRCVTTSNTAAVNYYRRLGVSAAATAEELKVAYRRRALECHPDVVDDEQKARAEVEFRAVSEAYDVLMDPQRRAEHDKALGVNSAAPRGGTTTPPGEKQQPGAAEAKTTTKTTTPPRSSRVSSAQRRKPFVRGDADRKFREVFHGMSIDQVIFQEQLRQRQAQQNRRREDTSSSSSPAGHEESLRRAMADAAERFAEKVRRQYGPSMLRHVKVQTALPTGPQPPPSDYMPFRPFHGWSVPEGVRTVPEPKMGPTSHATEEQVEFEEASARKRRDLPKHFPVLKNLDGSVMGRSETARFLEREHRTPHNMGKLYSFHRPY